jgi:uncharacterized protein
MDQRISLVTLGVSDLARSRRFYEGLGWRPRAAVEGEVVFFQLLGMGLALYHRANLARDFGVAESTGSGALSLALNVRTRDEVAQVLTEAKTAGASVLKPAADTPWGGHAGHFADPDGHLWEIAWNPHFAIAPDGAITIPG